MKKLILSLALTTVVSAFATDKDPYAEYGGEISLWPKDPGLFLFVNAQTKLADEKLAKPIKKLADEFYIDIRAKNVPSETFDIRKSPAMLKSYGAKGGIWVVDDPLLPVSLAAIEDGWGILNVAPLLADAPADAKLDKRLVKIVNRLFGEIHGVSDPTMMPACVTKQAVGLAGVDELVCADYSPDADSKISGFLAKLGYKQRKYGTYQDACEEGWAPKPTNAVQKAIWDKVHQLPTKPLTIQRESERKK